MIVPKKMTRQGYTKLAILLLIWLFVGVMSFNGNWAWGLSKAEASDTQTLGDLEIGDRVVDRTWLWEYRSNSRYRYVGGDNKKPVIWIVVAKDHYPGMEPHVTLLAEDLIGRVCFDNSSNRGSEYGSNHWGESGTPNAWWGVRPWLNSEGIHADQGLYAAMSDRFQSNILTTNLPNREWEEEGKEYITEDKIFIPSASELGQHASYEIGSSYEYFAEKPDSARIARLNEAELIYWTRSPSDRQSREVWYVTSIGSIFRSG